MDATKADTRTSVAPNRSSSCRMVQASRNVQLQHGMNNAGVGFLILYHDIRLRGMRGPMGLPIQKRRSSGRISRWRCGEFLVQFSPSANRETSGFRRKCVFSFILKVIIDFHYYFSKFHVLRHLW